MEKKPLIMDEILLRMKLCKISNDKILRTIQESRLTVSTH